MAITIPAWSAVIAPGRACNECHELSVRRVFNSAGVAIGDYCRSHSAIELTKANYGS